MRDAQLVRAVLDGGGLTHSELARRLNFRSAKTVSRWISGESRVSPDALEALRSLYVAQGNRYGDDDDVKYLQLFAGVYVSPDFDPIKAFRDSLLASDALPRRKRIRIEWAYGNSRFYRRQFQEAAEAFERAAAQCEGSEQGWRQELEQNLLGARLEMSKALPMDSPQRQALLEQALLLCQGVIETTPDSIAYFNALEVASQLGREDLCDEYLARLIEVSGGAYADPFYRATRHSLILATAPEFEFLRRCRSYQRLCRDSRDRFLAQPLRGLN